MDVISDRTSLVTLVTPDVIFSDTALRSPKISEAVLFLLVALVWNRICYCEQLATDMQRWTVNQ